MALILYTDATINRTEAARFLYKWKHEIKKLKQTTSFTEDELENLFVIHYKITKNGGPINRQRFRQICHSVLGIEEQRHFEKMYSILDPKHKSIITPDNWAKALSIMLRGDLKQQIDFVWSVYLPPMDTALNKETIKNYLKPTIVKKDSSYEANVQELVTELIKKLDRDQDGKISYTDFSESVKQTPILLECLGQCLPKYLAAEAFFVTFSKRPIERQLFRT